MKITYDIIPPYEFDPKWSVMKGWEYDLHMGVYKLPRFYRFETEEEAKNFILIEKLSS